MSGHEGMTTPALTPAQIEALDGPALTRLAWELGLAPQGTESKGQRILAYLTALTQPPVIWRPHEDVAQADAVFRGLRAHGWWTDVQGDADDGWCRATREGVEEEQCWPSATAPTEAHALVLVSILAVAHDRAQPQEVPS